MTPKFEYYPGGEAGRPGEAAKTSKRKGVDNSVDSVAEGQLYPGPADPHMKLLQQSVEEPGVLAGSSAKFNLPNIKCTSWQIVGGYIWIPLARRVDLDRVHRQIIACGLFRDVRPVGSAGGPFKERPWGHMTPYKTQFKYKGGTYQCGVTDDGSRDKPSSSGARLYLTGPHKEVGSTFNIIVSLCPQADFDGGIHNPAQAQLSDGRFVPYAAMSEEQVLKELALVSVTRWPWNKLTLEQKAQAIQVASAQARVWPNNSQPRMFLAKLSTEVANERLQQEELAGVSAASSSVADTAEVATALNALKQVSLQLRPSPTQLRAFPKLSLRFPKLSRNFP